VAEPVFRGGVWWQQQDDGSWLRWNEGTNSWEPSAGPPPDDQGLPPAPPMPGTGMPGQYGQYGAAAPGGQVPNYLVWSILTTLLCCLPAGIVAIVYSSQVSTKLAAGDYAGAVDSSNKARTWCIVSAVAGVVGAVIWIAVFAGSDASTSFS
jgi:Interferon-induced transmembrane protein